MSSITATNLEWLIRRSKIWDAIAPTAGLVTSAAADDDWSSLA